MKKLIFVVLVSIFLVVGVSQADLVAHYEFEGDANDSAGTNDGAFYGDAHIISDPQRGNVLSLDGVNDYVMAGDDACLDFVGEFTLCAWVKPAGTTTDGRIIYRYDPTSEDGYYLSQTDDSTVCFGMNTMVGGGGDYILSNNHPSSDWTHVLGTRDSSDKTMLYVNGVLQPDTTTVAGAIKSVGNLFIGVDYVHNFDFYGLIDDVRIYNHSLNQSEINLLVPEPCSITILSMGFLLLRKIRQ